MINNRIASIIISNYPIICKELCEYEVRKENILGEESKEEGL